MMVTVSTQAQTKRTDVFHARYQLKEVVVMSRHLTSSMRHPNHLLWYPFRRDQGTALPFHGFWGPVLEETEDFRLIVALAFFEETGILHVNHLSILVEDHKDGEAETGWIV